MQPGLSIVIPVYRSANMLPKLLERIAAVLPGLAQRYEVILVCDGSPDNSWSVISELAQTYPFVHGLNLARNYGQHNALLMGIREVQYDVIVTLDDDMQHPPEEIHKLLAKLDEGYDVVYGMPEDPQHSAQRNVASIMLRYTLQKAIGYPDAINISAFRAFRTKLRDASKDYRGKFVFLDMLLSWGTTRFASVPVQHDKRADGVSGYSWRKLVSHAINIITSYSSLPLQVASIMGFVFMFMGVFLFGYVILNYMFHDVSVKGFTTLAAMIAIFSGVQLFSLGVMGEYLSRIHFRSMGQPYGVVKDRTRN